MRQVIGSRNSKFEHLLHDPVTPQDLLATIDRQLGTDATRGLVNFSGRPIPILYDGQSFSQLV
jgi:hypothetical protein